MDFPQLGAVCPSSTSGCTLRIGKLLHVVLLTCLMAVICGTTAAAQDTVPDTSAQAANANPPAAGEGWFDRVARTQAEQPHWITPLVTVTPRLEEEFRFDSYAQRDADAFTTGSIGGGKGLELIPSERVEVILGMPAYMLHTRPGANNGLSDVSFLLKYRLVAANASKGDYIISLFMGVSAPTGSAGNGSSAAIFTPTIAAGKGWGNVDVQTTFALSFPGANTQTLGTSSIWNTALQYHSGFLWPEVELNTTRALTGPNAQHTLKPKRTQTFITPGLVLGRFPLHNRVGLTVGAGVQIAASSYHAYNHRYIMSIRLPF